jgi:amino acid transporter
MAHQDDLDAILEQEFEGVDQRRNEQSPSKRQQISYFTVVCLILNRTIGSGIFVTPRTILLGTGSAGISIILWTLGAVVSTCGLLVWLEFGLSVPIRVVPGGHERPVPRSGGEKNYLEYLFQRPKFLVTCMYGVAFLILGNLAGNSVAFGEYFMRALGYVDQDVPRSWNIGIALAGLTLVCLVHVFSRRGGILISNIFAMLKVLILLAIIVIGFAVASGARFGPGTSQTANLNLKNAFATPQKDVSSYTYSFFYVLYSYSGFEQPFYVSTRMLSHL